MGDYVNNLSGAFSMTINHLWNVPMQLLTTQGLADSTGFMLLALANNTITPPLKNALKDVPFAPYVRAIVDGAVMKANFIYGGACSSPSVYTTLFGK